MLQGAPGALDVWALGTVINEVTDGRPPATLVSCLLVPKKGMFVSINLAEGPICERL